MFAPHHWRRSPECMVRRLPLMLISSSTSNVKAGKWSVLIAVPEEVVAPALRRVAQANRDADGRGLLRASRGTNEPHARFLGRASTLSPVARDAARDDVLPVLAAPLRHGNDVIEGELRGGSLLAAVLTREVVPGVDVRARERDVVEPALDVDVPEKPNDRRQLEASHRSRWCG